MNALSQSVKSLYFRFEELRGRRIFIMPTRFGFMYLLVLFVMLLGAINYSNSLGHVLCFLLGSMGLIGILHTYRNISQLELISAAAKPVFAEQEIHFKLQLDNYQQPRRYALQLAHKTSTTKFWQFFKAMRNYLPLVEINMLQQDVLTTVTARIIANRRGFMPLGTVRLASQFPLGLFYTWTYFPTDYMSLVYPKPSGKLPLPSPDNAGELSSGGMQPGTDDFYGLTNYRPGDPVRSIAWKAAARDGELRVKRFTGPRLGQLTLCWDDVAQLSELEQKLSQLSLWILQAQSGQIDYGLQLPGTSIEPANGDAHQHQCLRALALYGN